MASLGHTKETLYAFLYEVSLAIHSWLDHILDTRSHVLMLSLRLSRFTFIGKSAYMFIHIDIFMHIHGCSMEDNMMVPVESNETSTSTSGENHDSPNSRALVVPVEHVQSWTPAQHLVHHYMRWALRDHRAGNIQWVSL